jgi:hypothetical protein
MRRETSWLIPAFGIMVVLFMVGLFALQTHYEFERPTVAEKQAGRIYPLNVHGIVYVTNREKLYVNVLEMGASTCSIAFALIVRLEIRRRKREGGGVASK